jgi:DNA topoisomerase VI subunit A
MIKVNCVNFGESGKSISPSIDRIRNISIMADFLLIVEKYSIFLQLAIDKFHLKYNCILVTGRGYPDVGTRYLTFKTSLHFSKKLYLYILLFFLCRELCAKLTRKIPSFILTDFDPHVINLKFTFSIKEFKYHIGHRNFSCLLCWISIHEKRCIPS